MKHLKWILFGALAIGGFLLWRMLKGETPTTETSATPLTDLIKKSTTAIPPAVVPASVTDLVRTVAAAIPKSAKDKALDAAATAYAKVVENNKVKAAASLAAEARAALDAKAKADAKALNVKAKNEAKGQVYL